MEPWPCVGAVVVMETTWSHDFVLVLWLSWKQHGAMTLCWCCGCHGNNMEP